MKTTVYFDDFNLAFQDCRPNNFSYEGLEVLFNYLTELENDTGEDMELDVIALCCDFCEDEYSNIFNTYTISCEVENPTEEDIKDAVMAYLYDNTNVIGQTEKTIIYQNF